MVNKKTWPLAFVTCIAAVTLLSLSEAAPKSKDKTAPTPDAEATAPATENNEDVNRPAAAGARQILGTYVGPFGNHRITVCLQNIIGETVNGYSVASGNERAFSGTLAEEKGAYVVRAKEPGDRPDDGIFLFKYNPEAKQLTGTWTPYKTPKKGTLAFDLARRDFKYSAKTGKYPQSSTRTLKTADVENVRPEDLRIMRNEIYARHGYTFRMKDMREYFEQQDWYMPISMNVSTQLTPIEEKNAALIKGYESYGSKYYDAFGR